MMNKSFQGISEKFLAGLPQMVIGIIGMSLFGAATLVFLILAVTLPFKRVFWTLFVCFGSGFAVSGVISAAGATKRNLAKRMRSYYEILDSRKVMTIEDMAAGTGRAPRLIQKDIREARKRKMAPDIWTDTEMTNIILGWKMYDLFLESEKNRKQR